MKLERATPSRVPMLPVVLVLANLKLLLGN